MRKLAERLRGLFEKFKGLSLGKKIAYCMLVFVVFFSLIALVLYTNNTKYGVLFSNMDSTDSKVVLDKLKSQNVKSKVQGTTILVPASQVDTLRLQLATSLTSGSKGFELFDNTSQFGMTDQEMTITYQRALEGELERTLKGFPQVDSARVHLVMQEDTAFVKDTNPSTASVTLKLKSGNNLTNDQVKAMVALLSGSVKNLKQENVEIVDQNMKLLTARLSKGQDNSATVAEATQNQQQLKTEYEKKLEDKIYALVQPVSSNGNVTVKVNADMDFNATQIDSVEKTAGPVVSQKTIDQTSTNGGTTNNSGSPLDNSTNSSTVSYPASTGSGNSSATYKETTTNNDNGQTETKTNVAPGKVLRLTASIIVDGAISDATKAEVSKIASNAIGFDASRNDEITVAGMKFNDATSKAHKADLAALDAANQKKLRQKLYQEVGIALGAVIVLAIIGISVKKHKGKNPEPVTGLEEGGLNVLIGNELTPKEPKIHEVFEPIDFESENKESHIESEIRNYAKNKPDQVTDIVKAWLADEER